MLHKVGISATLLCASALAQAPLDPTIQPPSSQSSNPNMTSPYPSSSTNPNSTAGSSSTGSIVPDPVLKEKAFIRRAADRSVAEIELAKLVEQKGSTDTVKQFGKQVGKDAEHTRRNLRAAASVLKVDVPSDVSRGAQKALDKLAKLSGPEFDHAFAQSILRTRKNQIPFYTDLAQNGTEPEVKNFAARTLLILERQRRKAEELAGVAKPKK